MMKNKLIENNDGSIMAVTTIALIPMIATIALGIDLGRSMLTQQRIQQAVDIAVVSAAISDSTLNDTMVEAIADRFFNVNAPSTFKDDPSKVFAASVDPSTNNISVNASMDVDTPFARAARVKDAVPVGADSLVRRSPKDYGPVCILMTSPSDSFAMRMNTNGHIEAPSCQVHINSNDNKALTLNNNSSVTASRVCMNGGFYGTGTVTPAAERCPVLTDPYAHLSSPAASLASCGRSRGTTFDANRNGTAQNTIWPGEYCGTFNINSKAVVHMKPGIYSFKNSTLIVNDEAKLIGEGVTIYFNDGGKMILNGGSIMKVSPPETGPYAGILFHESTETGRQHIINTNATLDTSKGGVIHLPSSEIRLNTGAEIKGPAHCTHIIAKFMKATNGRAKINLYDNRKSDCAHLPTGQLAGQTNAGVIPLALAR